MRYHYHLFISTIVIILSNTVVTSTKSSISSKIPKTKLVPKPNSHPTILNKEESIISRGGNTSKNMSVLAKIQNIREMIFPIFGKEEIIKFVLLGFIKLFIVMALTLTRDLKDTLVVTTCGAEAIAFLKIYGVLPAATLFITVYSKLSSTLSSKKLLFYTTCIPFFVFFILFNAVIYPNANSIQPSLETISSLLGSKAGQTEGALYIISKILSNWTLALYYIVAEIYSSVSVGLLFWQHANDVVPIHQAKRFYPLFAQMSAFAPIIAGQYMVRYASQAKSFGDSLNRITVAVALSGFLACAFYESSHIYIDRLNRRDGGSAATASAGTVKKKKKEKLSMTESAKFLISSPYLRYIATLVLGYGLTINFTEILWKSLVKRKYPNPLDYQRFMGNFSSAVGASTVVVILLGVQIIRILGWRVGALATPVLMGVLGIPFFTCILSGGLDTNKGRLSLAVTIGTIQSLLSKTGKYALFDPTTQMTYIPLDEESKVKGKAAIDVLGSRLGKSGGSLLLQGLVLFFGNILDAAPVVAILFYSVLFVWCLAANKLNGMFLEKSRAMEESDKDGKKKK